MNITKTLAFPGIGTSRHFFGERSLLKKILCKSLSFQSPIDVQDEAEEVKIPMPWGHISGKWWNSKDLRPVLCIHGWHFSS